MHEVNKSFLVMSSNFFSIETINLIRRDHQKIQIIEKDKFPLTPPLLKVGWSNAAMTHGYKITKTTKRHFPKIICHDTRQIRDILHPISLFSFYVTPRLFKNSSLFEIGAFINAFKHNINSRIYHTEKCRD